MTKIYKLTFILAFLFTISACRKSGELSDEQIERAKKTVSQIRESLYTPTCEPQAHRSELTASSS